MRSMATAGKSSVAWARIAAAVLGSILNPKRQALREGRGPLRVLLLKQGEQSERAEEDGVVRSLPKREERLEVLQVLLVGQLEALGGRRSTTYKLDRALRGCR